MFTCPSLKDATCIPMALKSKYTVTSALDITKFSICATVIKWLVTVYQSRNIQFLLEATIICQSIELKYQCGGGGHNFLHFWAILKETSCSERKDIEVL